MTEEELVVLDTAMLRKNLLDRVVELCKYFLFFPGLVNSGDGNVETIDMVSRPSLKIIHRSIGTTFQ